MRCSSPSLPPLLLSWLPRPPRAPSLRRTYRHEAIKLEAKPKGLKRIKKALNLGPKEEEGEESIEVAV